MTLTAAYAADEACEDARASRIAAKAEMDEAKARRFPLNRSGAQQAAKAAARAALERSADDAKLRDLCESYRVEMPESEFGRHCVVARLTERQWWGRKIRTADWRAYETERLRLGEISHYVSDEIARARRWHRAALAELLSTIYAVREDETAFFTLAELAQRSVANPAIRRAEMIVRAKGMARWRAEQGFTWTFVTITAPGKYHRMTTAGGAGLKPNPRWNGATPRETQGYLCDVWARIRSALRHAGIDWSAFRTVEPHADGTPHWHLCCFVRPADLERFRAIVRRYALAEDSDETGAQRFRVTFEDYRPQDNGTDAGDAAAMADRCIAYLIAYVSKNLDGHKVDGAVDTHDGARLEMGDAVEGAARVEAWATLWGIRQFAELGGGPVTAWRELRRVRETVTGPIEPARAAADAGQYALFIAEARAAGLTLWSETSRDRIERLAREAGLPADRATPELAAAVLEAPGLLNRWGEPAGRWIQGVQAAGRQLLTRATVWRIVDALELRKLAINALARCAGAWRSALDLRRAFALAPAVAHDFGRRESGAPWTCVNNCAPQARGGPP